MRPRREAKFCPLAVRGAGSVSFLQVQVRRTTSNYFLLKREATVGGGDGSCPWLRLRKQFLFSFRGRAKRGERYEHSL